eukprot:8104666-Pyramimonas_sp.AAC.1
MFGCIPVIVQDDISQPFEDQLPYHRFSLRGKTTSRSPVAMATSVTRQSLHVPFPLLYCYMRPRLAVRIQRRVMLLGVFFT